MAKQVDSSNIVGLLQDVFTKIKSAFWAKGDTSQLAIDNTPTSASDNLVKSGGVYDAITAKYTKPAGGIPASDLASGVIPTISTDIQADKSSTTKTAAPSAVYNEVHPAVENSEPVGGMLPNVFYDLGTLAGDTTFTFATASDATIVNEWMFQFATPATAPTITWPNAITAWAGGSAPTINASKTYQVSVINGLGLIAEF